MLRIRARWIVPIASPPVAGGIVALDDGRITYVGEAAGAPAGDDLDLGDALLLPGLVNAHTHLELTAMRGLLENLEFPTWVRMLTDARRTVLSREDLLDSARLGIAEGLAAGITTYADTSESGVTLQAMQEAGVRGVMYQEVFGPDPASAPAALNGLRDRVEAGRGSESALARLGVSPHAPYSVSDALFIDVASYALRERLPVAIHIAESRAELELVRDGAGPFADMLRARGIEVRPRAGSPIALLAHLGVLSARPLLIHCVHAEASDLRLISASGCGVAHCPASNAKLGHGVAPLAELLRMRVAVGLGSDSMASNNRMHLLEEARLALLFQRARTARCDLPTADAALELATLGGARALGMSDRIGSLEVGKEADLAAFPLDSAASTPAFDPAAAAIFALGGARASFVTVAGEVLVRDGALTRADPRLTGRVRSAGDRLAAWRREPRREASSGPARAARDDAPARDDRTS